MELIRFLEIGDALKKEEREMLSLGYHTYTVSDRDFALGNIGVSKKEIKEFRLLLKKENGE